MNFFATINLGCLLVFNRILHLRIIRNGWLSTGVAILFMVSCLGGCQSGTESETQSPQDHIGNIHGVRLSIPAQYLFFPVEYKGESVWAPEPNKPERTPDSPISNFAVYVQWPDFQPRSQKNEKSYKASLRETGTHDWFMVALVAENLDPSIQTPPLLDNGLARVLKGYFTHPERYGIPKSIRYEVRDHDARLGLDIALPVGPGVEKFRWWNKALYWDGEKDHITTLIMCGHGQLPDPQGITQCSHHFELSELNSDITVTYTADWLLHWREIEAKSRELILSFRTSGQ